MDKRDALIKKFPEFEDKEYVKAFLCEKFPNLTKDKDFKLTSDIDFNYNCLAWAIANYKDRWMQHFPSGQVIDGVWYWWPNEVTKSPDIFSYIEAFKKRGYELCKNQYLETDFIKVALYHNPLNNYCTHAARQLLDGTWKSKLGWAWDIVHGSPESVENDEYGKIYCYMKIIR